MTLDDAELALYGDSGGSLAAAAEATPDPVNISLWDSIRIAGLKTEAGILNLGASAIGYIGGKLTSLGEASENAKMTIETTASNAISWVENKLIWLVIIIVVIAGLVYFGKKKIDKLAG